ncbi:carboxylesterase [Jannaschia sp. M317]|uniref:alpha/beta hydrolase n=1 Tax=Jannaschia sp. M317 TaxID=2867011 RepID=UPI0021A29342|nr:alpha/beta hydrolase [Jannaschia sp. M317]UWQ16878.1 alpha/beta hydrolase [Jannaschia sp. M317]
MAKMLRGMIWGLILLGLAGTAIWLFGPYEEVETQIDFDPAAVPADIDGWLSDRESQVADLRPDAAKRVLWAGAPGQRSAVSLVYLHGFSADLWETRPVTDRLAETLGANVFYQRLAGHGRDGDAMAEPAAGDWLEDVAEAMEIGRRIGDRVVIIGASTGGTLAAVLAADPGLATQRRDLAGVILISPNFKVANPIASLLSWPAARQWVPLIAGETRRFEPANARHAKHWTHEYPTRALLPMQALLDYAMRLDWAQAEIPALFYFSPEDTVVDAETTEGVAARWAGPVQISRVTLPAGDDPHHHVIAGDILSPGHTPAAIADLTAWLQALPR